MQGIRRVDARRRCLWRGRPSGIERAGAVRRRGTGRQLHRRPAHWLFAPYDSCALLYRDPASARAAHAQNANYLDRIDREMWNPADLAVHLSRRVRGLPFWFSLATHGTDRYASAVERTLDVSRTVADAIRSSSHLDLVC